MIESHIGAGMVVATISRVLRDHGRPLYDDDLIDAFRGHDVAPDEVRLALTVMLANGLVAQPAPGWWSKP